MSPGSLILLLVLATTSATRVITRAMIRGPQAGGGGFQRVPLLSPGEDSPRASARVLEPGAQGTGSPPLEGARLEEVHQSFGTGSPETARPVRREAGLYLNTARQHLDTPSTNSGPPLREVSQRLDEDEEDSPLEEVQLRYSEPVQSTTEEPTTVPTEILQPMNASQVQPNKTTGKRTRLYPVARLWEDRSETDIWSLLHAAYLCCFSGLHCFSDKLYPMFRSYLGLNTGTRPTRYPLLLPRTANTQDNETEEEESRGLLKGRLVKELLVGLLLAHASLLPWLGGVGLASGKALFTGLLSLGAAGAVAAINSHNNYFM